MQLCRPILIASTLVAMTAASTQAALVITLTEQEISGTTVIVKDRHS